MLDRYQSIFYTRETKAWKPKNCVSLLHWGCGCWELNLEPLDKQAVLLTTEPSLQPRPDVFNLHDLSLVTAFSPESATVSIVWATFELNNQKCQHM